MEDALKEIIKGRIYPEEVQKVKVFPRKWYTIEKIIYYKGKGSNRQALMKWKEYREKFNTWEPVSNIAKYQTQIVYYLVMLLQIFSWKILKQLTQVFSRNIILHLDIPSISIIAHAW